MEALVDAFNALKLPSGGAQPLLKDCMQQPSLQDIITFLACLQVSDRVSAVWLCFWQTTWIHFS